MRYSETVAQRADRWSAKTLDRLFENDLSQGFGVPPLVAELIVQRGRDYYWESALHGALQPGQQRVLVVADTEPAGKPIRWCQLRSVVVTVDAGPDDAEVLRRDGRQALRRFRECRLAEQCCDQGGLATVEDLARLLGVDPRTVLRDLRWLREQEGVFVATRGQQKDIGPSVSHRVKAVELYLRRTTFTEICQRLRHSAAAVRRYLTTFSQIVYLHRRDIPWVEICFLVRASERLVTEYVNLYQRYDTPDYRERLAEIAAEARFPTGAPLPKKGGRR